MTTAVQLAQSVAPGVSLGFKNRIINGAMTIDQRNAGASYAAVNGGYSLDRWACYSYSGGGGTTGKYTVQQNAGSVTPPAGFSKYLGATSSGVIGTATDDIYGFRQSVEGLNVSDLAWGTSSAQPVTLSFWVRSSVTGTFGGSFRGTDLYYIFSYTISSANTWEYKTITIAGPTTGTWVTNNTQSFALFFQMQVGTDLRTTPGSWGSNYWAPTGCVNLLTNAGATFYITGVQLEVGTTATPFEFRDYGRELIMCQRYCISQIQSRDAPAGSLYLGIGTQYTGNNNYGPYTFPVQMRAAPSFFVSSAGHFSVQVGGTSAICTTVGGNGGGNQTWTWYVVTGTTFTLGYAGVVYSTTPTAQYTFSAEL